MLLTHWPAHAAALARLHAEEPDLADRVEAFVGGLELSNGFSELTDAHEQRARLESDDGELSMFWKTLGFALDYEVRAVRISDGVEVLPPTTLRRR